MMEHVSWSWKIYKITTYVMWLWLLKVKIGQCIQQTVKTNFADSMQKYWYEKRDQAR